MVPDIEGSSIQGLMTPCYCLNKTSIFLVNYTRTPKVIRFSDVATLQTSCPERHKMNKIPLHNSKDNIE